MLGALAGTAVTQSTAAPPQAGTRAGAATPQQASAATASHPRLIEVLADHDSRYKIAGQDKPMLTLTAGESVRLRITAVRAKNKNRDGAVHGFTLLHAKDRTPVPGWDFMLMPGVQEFEATAPESGEYVVVCTVICSSGHEQMNMKITVTPPAK